MWVKAGLLETIELILLVALIVAVCIAIYYTAMIKCDALGLEFNFVNAVLRW